jgi:hypothetical protein
MKSRAALVAAVLPLALAVHAFAHAEAAGPPVPVPDPSAIHLDSLPPLRPYSIVRVPSGADPTRPPDSTVAPPAKRKDGLPVPGQRYFIHLGFGFPLAPAALTQQWNTGGAFGAGLDLVFEKRFALRLRGDWAQLPFNSRTFLKRIGLYGTGAVVEGGAASLVTLASMARVHGGGEGVHWALEGGPSVGMMRTGDALLFDPVTSTLYESRGDEEFAGGISAGAGLEFVRHDGSGLFLDLHWNGIFTQGKATQFIPFTIGIVFP